MSSSPSAPPDHDSFVPPDQVDEFELVRPLGRGGMGHVYLGHDTLLDRPVALKFIAGPCDLAQRGRFLVEARAIARLQHPHVVAIYRIGDVLGMPYIAYEYVDGLSLDHVRGPLAWPLLLEVALGAARGLAASHRSGVVHRDLKPANVMRATSGAVKLIDFGLAKLGTVERRATPVRASFRPDTAPTRPLVPGTATMPAQAEVGALTPELEALRASLESGEALTGPGLVIGTPLYAAPELWNGVPASMASDVYSLGLVLHELATGKPPRGTIPEGGQLFVPALFDPEPLRAVAPELPTLLADAIDACLARDPQARCATGAELCAALEDAERLLRLVRGRGSDAVSEDERLLLASLARLEPRARALSGRFYERLFAQRPDLRALFPARMDEQHVKLFGAVQLSVENLAKPERLLPLLEALGKKHAPYGVTPADFAEVGVCLIDALKELDAAWSDATERAWSSAYHEVSSAMLRGMGAVA